MWLASMHEVPIHERIKERDEIVIMQAPFNAKTKVSVTAIQLPYGGFIRVLVKGAPEAVLPICKTYLTCREG